MTGSSSRFNLHKHTKAHIYYTYNTRYKPRQRCALYLSLTALLLRLTIPVQDRQTESWGHVVLFSIPFPFSVYTNDKSSSSLSLLYLSLPRRRLLQGSFPFTHLTTSIRRGLHRRSCCHQSQSLEPTSICLHSDGRVGRPLQCTGLYL